MQIKHLSISNFRGIKSLDWFVTGTMVCLIGANDSTKSTILHAIENALSPKWNLSFSDTDFYACDTNHAIQIEIVVSHLPDSLLSLEKYGEYLMGLHPVDGLVEEPTDECEAVLKIKLVVSQALEPSWDVICGRGEKRISAVDRQQLGLAFVSSHVDRDFSWGKGTPLSRVTDDTNGLNFSEINRQARTAIADIRIEQLDNASLSVQDLSKPYGVHPATTFKPAFDPESISINTGALALHDGNIPIRQYGLGSKRLVSLAMQKSMTKDGAIVLVDEVEHGLEPYRLRQLIRLLRPPQKIEEGDDKRNYPSQVIMTTHSPISIVELQANELHIVRSTAGITTVLRISPDLQALVRSMPEALLSPRVVVCEGKTEVGILRAMDRFWASTHQGAGFAFCGVHVVDGDGNTKAPNRAIELKQLGYDVILFVDSDKPCNPSVEEVETHDIEVVVWEGKTNTEGRLFLDLPLLQVLKIVDLALSTLNAPDVLSNLGSALKQSGMTRTQLETLLMDGDKEQATRMAIASVASSKNSWFKRTDLAESIGDIAATSLQAVPDSDFATKLQQVHRWVYGS